MNSTGLYRQSLRYFWQGKVVVAFLLGCLMPFAFSPYNYKWLAVLALAGWMQLFMRGNAFGVGWAFGLGWFGVGAWWLAPTFHTFGPLAWPWAVLATALVGFVLGLFPAVLAWSSYKLTGDSAPRMLVVFPVLVVAEEWLRGHLFTGLPWTPLGSLLLDTSAIGWAAIVGVYGVAFLPALMVVSLVFMLKFKYYRLGLAGAVIAGVCLIAAPTPYSADGTLHHVALIQANIPQKLKWNANFLNETMRRYARLSKQAAERSDLIIWPEVAVPMFLERSPAWREWLRQHMHEWNRSVLFGGLKLDDDGRAAHNGVYLFQPGRKKMQFIGKQHLVPFGEYVPAWIPFLHALVPNIADFKPAVDLGVLQGANGRYGSLVCYEAIFPREARQRVKNHASVLVNVTNDAWYGHTPATRQDLQAARMRAVETGRYLLRAANTGVSAIVAPDGSIKSTIDWFTQGVVYGTYRNSDTITPYQRWGDFPLLALIVPLLFIGWIKT